MESEATAYHITVEERDNKKSSFVYHDWDDTSDLIKSFAKRGFNYIHFDIVSVDNGTVGITIGTLTVEASNFKSSLAAKLSLLNAKNSTY